MDGFAKGNERVVQSSHNCISERYSTEGCWGVVLFTMHGDMLGITLWSAVKNWPWGPVLLSQSSSELDGSAERRLWILQSGRRSSNSSGRRSDRIASGHEPARISRPASAADTLHAAGIATVLAGRPRCASHLR